MKISTHYGLIALILFGVIIMMFFSGRNQNIALDEKDDRIDSLILVIQEKDKQIEIYIEVYEEMSIEFLNFINDNYIEWGFNRGSDSIRIEEYRRIRDE